MLPTVVDNSYNFGHVHKSLFGHEIRIGSSVRFMPKLTNIQNQFQFAHFFGSFHLDLKDWILNNWNLNRQKKWFFPNISRSSVINRRRCGDHVVSTLAISRSRWAQAHFWIWIPVRNVRRQFMACIRWLPGDTATNPMINLNWCIVWKALRTTLAQSFNGLWILVGFNNNCSLLTTAVCEFLLENRKKMNKKRIWRLTNHLNK